jgi:hypothetical protein
MPAERVRIVDGLIRALSPYLGPNMARAATLGHCAKLNIKSGPVDDALIDELLAAIHPGLSVFVGREKTAQILAEVRQEIFR